MDKIRIDIFDILGYLVPGSALLMIGWIAADSQVQSVWQIYQSIHKVDTKAIYLGLLLSYFFGFILHILGSALYDKYLHYKKPTMAHQTALTTPEKWTLIREYGEKHIPILERWYALRAFSQNLIAISVLSFLICFYKWMAFGYYEWGIASIIFILSFFILSKRALTFHDMLNNDMAAVLKKLNLENK